VIIWNCQYESRITRSLIGLHCSHSSVPLYCRVTLRYGGRDITRTFSWLLDHISFPYIDCQPERNILDTMLLQELKHTYCHMDTVSFILLSCSGTWLSYLTDHVGLRLVGAAGVRNYVRNSFSKWGLSLIPVNPGYFDLVASTLLIDLSRSTLL